MSVKANADRVAAMVLSGIGGETVDVSFIDKREYRIRSKQLQNTQAVHSGMTFQGKPIHYKLKDSSGPVIDQS